MSERIIPQLVYDTEARKICLQIKIGSEVATQELPEWLAAADAKQIKEYMDTVVPEMVAGLRAKRIAKRKTIAKKAQT